MMYAAYPDCVKNVKSIHTIKKLVYMKKFFNTPHIICFIKQQQKCEMWNIDTLRGKQKYSTYKCLNNFSN